MCTSAITTSLLDFIILYLILSILHFSLPPCFTLSIDHTPLFLFHSLNLPLLFLSPPLFLFHCLSYISPFHSICFILSILHLSFLLLHSLSLLHLSIPLFHSLDLPYLSFLFLFPSASLFHSFCFNLSLSFSLFQAHSLPLCFILSSFHVALFLLSFYV